MPNLKRPRQQLGGQKQATPQGGQPVPTTPPAKVPPTMPPLPAQPRKAQVAKPQRPPKPKQEGEKNPPTGQPSGSKGKKNPTKDAGVATVDPEEEDSMPSEDGESDIDALSHLPTDEGTGSENEDSADANVDPGEQC